MTRTLYDLRSKPLSRLLDQNNVSFQRKVIQESTISQTF